MSYTLLAWAASATRTFVAGATEHSSGVGHAAFQRIPGCGKCLFWASVGEAYCVRKFEFLQQTSRVFLKRDRQLYMQMLLEQAATAARRYDLRGSFTIVRILSGQKAKQIKSVLREDGTPILDEEEMQHRW